MKYNTQRKPMLLREYGRNIQDMASYLLTVEDRDKRTSYADTLVKMMRNINPNVKDSPEYEQKVWDDLFIICNFDLDVDGPFPKPEDNILERKPDRVKYQSNKIRYRHYGASIERLIETAVKLETKEEKEAATITIGKLMKSFYFTWNKEQIEDEHVIKNIKKMSDDQLDIDIEKVKELKLFEMAKRDRTHDHRKKSGGRTNVGGGGKGRRRKRY